MQYVLVLYREVPFTMVFSTLQCFQVYPFFAWLVFVCVFTKKRSLPSTGKLTEVYWPLQSKELFSHWKLSYIQAGVHAFLGEMSWKIAVLCTHIQIELSPPQCSILIWNLWWKRYYLEYLFINNEQDLTTFESSTVAKIPAS